MSSGPTVPEAREMYRKGVRAKKYLERIGDGVSKAVGYTRCEYSLELGGGGFYMHPNNDIGTPITDWPSSLRLGVLPAGFNMHVGKSRCLLKVDDLPNIFPAGFDQTAVKGSADTFGDFPPSGAPIHLIASGTSVLSCWHHANFQLGTPTTKMLHKSLVEMRDAILGFILQEVNGIIALPSRYDGLLFRTSVHVSMHALRRALLEAGVTIVAFAQEHQGCTKDSLRHLDHYAARAWHHVQSISRAFPNDPIYHRFRQYNAHEICVDLASDRACFVGSYKDTPRHDVKVFPMLPGMLMNAFGSLEIDFTGERIFGENLMVRKVRIESRFSSHVSSLRRDVIRIADTPASGEQVFATLRLSRHILEELASTESALLRRQAGGIHVKLTVVSMTVGDALSQCRTAGFHDPIRLFDELGLFKELTDESHGATRRSYPLQRIPLEVVIAHGMRVVSAGFSALSRRTTKFKVINTDVGAALGQVNPDLPCSEYAPDKEFWVYRRERIIHELRLRVPEKRGRGQEEAGAMGGGCELRYVADPHGTDATTALVHVPCAMRATTTTGSRWYNRLFG